MKKFKEKDFVKKLALIISKSLNNVIHSIDKNW